MNVHARQTMTFEEYERWAESQERKHELVRGEPRMLPYVKFEHTRIANAVRSSLLAKLDRAKFEVVDGDFAIRTGPHSARFADAAIVPANTPPSASFTENPILAIEVLSQSTMHNDFGEKRFEYQALASLRAYLVLAQETPSAWLWQRDENGEWPKDPQLFEGRELEIALACVGAKLLMSEIYRA
jgi:Uma2 family endonuclease